MNTEKSAIDCYYIHTMRIRFLFLSLLLAAGLYAQPKPLKIDRFESTIQAFLEIDKTNPPAQGQIEFIGSSIFARWKTLQQQMAPLPVYNRAFGGSRTPEILHYMDKVVLPYAPKIIVYYCGSNDVSDDESATVIADNFKAFAERVHEKLPDTRIYFVSINRAPQKQDKWDVVDAANGIIRAFCERTANMGFIDVNSALFNAEGKARLELYLPDKLHFLDPAYVEFTKIIKPVLTKAWAER